MTDEVEEAEGWVASEGTKATGLGDMSLCWSSTKEVVALGLG